MHMKIVLHLILVWSVVCFSNLSFAKNTFVGVISYSNVFTGKQTDPQVVPLFKKESTKWTELLESENSSSWDIILNGKAIGKLESKTKKIPTLKKVPIVFDSFLGDVTQKAFAIVSHGSAKDPNQWKPYRFSAVELKEKQALFLKTIKRDSINERKHFRCPGFWKLPDEQKKTSKDSCKNEFDKIVLNKSYRDKNGTIIAQFILETDKAGDFDGTTEVINKWIVQNAGTKNFKFIFSQDEDIWDAYLIEAADFDNSGESKLLFEKSGYNQFSYELFDSSLKKLAVKNGSFN